MSENLVEDYGWKSDTGPQSCGYITPKILEILQEVHAKRVVDIGAGNGALCHFMKDSGMDVVGIEYDKNGVEVARSQCKGVNFYNFGVQDDPQLIVDKEGQFDTVVSTEVIEHLFSPHLLPQYAYPLLKKGGNLIVSTPYHGYLKNCAIAVFNRWDHHHAPLWHGGHIKFWSQATLTKLLEGNGFSVRQFHGVGRFPFLWKSMILVAEKI